MRPPSTAELEAQTNFQAVDVRWLWPSLHPWTPLVCQLWWLRWCLLFLVINSSWLSQLLRFRSISINAKTTSMWPGDWVTHWLRGGAPQFFVFSLWLRRKINAVPEDKFQYATYKSDTVWNQRGVDLIFTFLHLVPANMNWMVWCFFLDLDLVRPAYFSSNHWLDWTGEYKTLGTSCVFSRFDSGCQDNRLNKSTWDLERTCHAGT